jgi:hypothetical protein
VCSRSTQHPARSPTCDLVCMCMCMCCLPARTHRDTTRGPARKTDPATRHAGPRARPTLREAKRAARRKDFREPGPAAELSFSRSDSTELKRSSASSNFLSLSLCVCMCLSLSHTLCLSLTHTYTHSLLLPDLEIFPASADELAPVLRGGRAMAAWLALSLGLAPAWCCGGLAPAPAPAPARTGSAGRAPREGMFEAAVFAAGFAVFAVFAARSVSCPQPRREPGKASTPALGRGA